MKNSLLHKENEITSAASARGGQVHGWQRWAPYAAVAWSLVYAALGIYWALSGSGLPFASAAASTELGSVVGRLGPEATWIVVFIAGIPAAAAGTAMLRGMKGRISRPLLITAGVFIAGTLLLLMIEFNFLIQLAYIPYGVFSLITGTDFGQKFLESLAQTKWSTLHQLLCLTGGFIWLAATVSYVRQSKDACLYCGRQDGPEGWTSPGNAMRWGRVAVYAAISVPTLYAFTRYAWALGFPLGMTVEHWRQGQERGEWTSGLFLATVGLAGGLLTLGLIQRWGEVFPRWMIGLADRQVPIALAVIPASIMSVLFLVAGIAMWSGYNQMADAAVTTGEDIGIVAGPVLLFPIWGIALAAATLGYYFRRRGPCRVCGRGVLSNTEASAS